MIKESDQLHHARRAREERALAVSVTDPAAAAIHAELAERYAALASENVEERSEG